MTKTGIKQVKCMRCGKVFVVHPQGPGIACPGCREKSADRKKKARRNRPD